MSQLDSPDAVAHDDISFNMVRQNLEKIPYFDLPRGYRFRTYANGDEDRWTGLQKAAEPFLTVSDDLFVRQFPQNQAALTDRMFFVEDAAGDVVGSITAWWKSDWNDPANPGRIHWVVVHPTHQRQGLSKPMMTHAMQRLAQSHTSAMLGTSSARLWAVKVYLDFGFGPDKTELADPQILGAWRDIQGRLRHPGLTGTLP